MRIGSGNKELFLAVFSETRWPTASLLESRRKYAEYGVNSQVIFLTSLLMRKEWCGDLKSSRFLIIATIPYSVKKQNLLKLQGYLVEQQVTLWRFPDLKKKNGLNSIQATEKEMNVQHFGPNPLPCYLLSVLRPSYFEHAVYEDACD